MSFKLIAIRPLSGIDTKFLKNLVAGEIYNLCNDYILKNDQGKLVRNDANIISVQYKRTVPENLYSIQKIDGKVININVSAIVGKNGAGKSSLIDLLLLSIFVVSNNLDLVYPDNFIEQDSKITENDELNKYKNDIVEIEKGLKVEIYYLLNERFYKLVIN